MLIFKDPSILDLKIAREYAHSEGITKNSSYSLDMIDPLTLLEGLGLTMEPCPEKEVDSIISFIISQGNDPHYNWKGLLTSPLPPVVVVEDTLVDGIHRCIAAVASRSVVKAIVFKK